MPYTIYASIFIISVRFDEVPVIFHAKFNIPKPKTGALNHLFIVVSGEHKKHRTQNAKTYRNCTFDEKKILSFFKILCMTTIKPMNNT